MHAACARIVGLACLLAALTGCASGPRAYVDLSTEWRTPAAEHYGTAEAGIYLSDRIYLYGAHRSCVPCRAGEGRHDNNAAGIGYRIEWGGR